MIHKRRKIDEHIVWRFSFYLLSRMKKRKSQATDRLKNWTHA